MTVQQWRLKKYFHFSKRLYERYNLYITFDEYLTLCHAPEEKIKDIDKKVKSAVIKIKGFDVLVLKQKYGTRLLLTALNFRKNSRYL